jgi:hypothetical protein
MNDTFDPYHKWLGIPPDEQPPNNYCLLGLHEFEDDPDVIANAADQRMSHLRSFQTGESTLLAQALLNEVSAARICLLNVQRKAQYDQALRRQFSAHDAPANASPTSRQPFQPGGAAPQHLGAPSPGSPLRSPPPPDSPDDSLPSQAPSPPGAAPRFTGPE